jgi:F-box protein 10
VDLTRWKELYLGCKEWRHPFWPLGVHSDPESWKEAYRHQQEANKFWNMCVRQTNRAGCMTLLKVGNIDDDCDDDNN